MKSLNGSFQVNSIQVLGNNFVFNFVNGLSSVISASTLHYDHGWINGTYLTVSVNSQAHLILRRIYRGARFMMRMIFNLV